MPKKFYISDLHFGHNNAIRFDNRPFENVEEMNSELIRRWNEAVGDEDTVYILGDMFWIKPSDAAEVLKKLKGKKILIKGNHDRIGDKSFDKSFERITDYLEVEDGERRIVLCHYPIPCFKNHFYGWYHFYGHVHNSREWDMIEDLKRRMVSELKVPCEMYNVGVMMPYIDYTPRTADEILKGASSRHGY